MLKDLKWCSLDQRRMHSRLVMLYNVTYALLQSPHPSTSSAILGRFPLLKPITDAHFSRDNNYSLECLASPHTGPSHIGTFQQRCLPDPCLSLNTSFCFLLPFKYINTLFTLYKLNLPPFLCFYFTNPLQHLVCRNLSDFPPQT